MSTQADTTSCGVLHDSDIVHVICCRNDRVALCGHQDAEWYDVDQPPDCVVCLDIEESCNVCPVDNRVCELYLSANHPSVRGRT